MNVDVLIPYHETPDRAPLLEIILGFYRDLLPAWRLIVMDDPTGEPFATGRAINAALWDATAPVVVYQDADSIVPFGQLIQAVRSAEHSGGLVKAFNVYHRLNAAYTSTVKSWLFVEGDPYAEEAIEWTQSPVCAMGVSAIRRDVFLELGGFDPRFNGWGYDDIALEILANATCGIRRVSGPLYHLHHERRPSEQDDELQTANAALCSRYSELAGDGDKLLELRREDHDAIVLAD